MRWLNNILGRVTMYRLMLYYLLFLLVAALFGAFLGRVPVDPWELFGSAIFFVAVCVVSNKIFAQIFRAKPNLESKYITALILTLIVTPSLAPMYLKLYAALGIMAMASKYVLAIKKRHIFNPAAIAAVLGAIFFSGGASWWIGNEFMFWPLLLGGLAMVYKIRRFQLILSFLIPYLLLSARHDLVEFHSFADILQRWQSMLFFSPILFFCFVMLVEPLTSPYTIKFRIWFGILIAVVFETFSSYVTSIPYGLELALLVGNVFAYVVNPKARVVMALKRRDDAARNTRDFWFEPEKQISFIPGQYFEWTLPHSRSDSRGVRRYFSIASSPTEKEVLLSTRMAKESSSFKKALDSLPAGGEVIAANLSGEFVLPKDPVKKLVFIAGGIGITPFRSMIKYLLDKKEKRDIVLMYSNRTEADVAFRAVLDEAGRTLGIKLFYVITDKEGFIDEQKIKNNIIDWRERMFYVSGPEPMVQAFEKMLAKMELPKKQIKRDYFPGYE